MPRVDGIESTVTNPRSGLTSYIRIKKWDHEMELFVSSPDGTTVEATFSYVEAHEVLNMLHHALD